MAPPPARAGPGAPTPPRRRNWRAVLLWGAAFVVALLVPFLITHGTRHTKTAAVAAPSTSASPALATSAAASHPSTTPSTSAHPATPSVKPSATTSATVTAKASSSKVAVASVTPTPSASTTPGTTTKKATTPAAGGATGAGGAGGATVSYVVRRGDSLWSITAAQLGSGASAARIGALWPTYYARNRAVVGSNPDLLMPGEVLKI